MVISLVGCRGSHIVGGQTLTSAGLGGAYRIGQLGSPGSVAIGDIKPIAGQTSVPPYTYSWLGRGTVTRLELLGTGCLLSVFRFCVNC